MVKCDAIKAVLIDDEKHCRDVLNTKLKIYCPEVIVMESCRSVSSGIRSIKQHQPDLVFLDITMPGEDGFSLFDKLNDISFEVIFTTGYDQYAVKAFACNALHFLLKPIKREDLVSAVQRFKDRSVNASVKQYRGLMADLNMSKSDRFISHVKQEEGACRGVRDGLESDDQLFLDKVLFLIRENYSRSSFGVDQLSAYLGLSRMQLYRKLRNLSELTPGELLLKYRLDIAKELLLNRPHRKVSDIAHTVGYGNKSNFSRAFKEYTGVTPSEFVNKRKVNPL